MPQHAPHHLGIALEGSNMDSRAASVVAQDGFGHREPAKQQADARR
jgi:hypothetical protein